MGTSRTTLVAFAVLVLAFALGGCANGTGGDSPPDPGVDQLAVDDAVGGTAPDEAPAESEPESAADVIPAACPLLAGIDANALLAEPAAEPVDSNGICTVDPVDPESPASLILQVVGTPDGASYFDRDKALLGSDAEIPHLGDAAYLAGKRVNILVGDNYLYLQALRNPVGGAGQLDDESLLAAARIALTNTGW